MEEVSYIAAFIAGVVSFLSPCVLPLVPAYISYLTGISFKEASSQDSKDEKRHIRIITAIHAGAFILGFSLVFVLLGASVTFLGSILLEYQSLIKKLGGILIIIFALAIMGVIKIPFLRREAKISYKKEGVSFFGSFLVGATFAAAWTPCIGPILGSILVYASSSASIKTGIKLLIAFSLGLGVPFFLSAIAINSFLSYMDKIKKYLKYINILAGIILITFGLMLLLGRGTI